MIVKGIIKSIDFGSNTCMVRIPTWEPVGNPETVIPAVFSVTPGTFNSYKENDVVWVAFENNIASKPVIIGKLYTGTNADKTEPRGVVNCQSLTVSDSAVLPASTKITQATSDILDERNGLQVKTLEELISAVAANAASVSNLVIWEENPTLGNIEYSYAFSAIETSISQPTNTDWDILKGIADDKGLTNGSGDDAAATLTKDDLTTTQFESLSLAAQLWLTAGGEWKWPAKATDPTNPTKLSKTWVPQTGYISEETWVENYAEKNSYPLLCVFKHTRYVYYKQGLSEVRTTEELIRSPRVSYPTEYSLKMTADTHAGVNQSENLYITAVKRFAGSLEENDTTAYLWYWNPNPDSITGEKKWVLAQNKYIFNFTIDNFKKIVKDRDLVIIATHIKEFDPNTFKDGTKFPDPLEQTESLSTWKTLVADERVYEIETIPYSPLNTPVINLDNDSAALPYDEDGNEVLYNTTVSTTAQVFLNGEDISTDFDFAWLEWYYNNDNEWVSKSIENTGDLELPDKPASVSNEGRTLKVGVAGTYEVVATKNKDASPSYSIPTGGLTKTFTVAKQLQGEAMMSSVITSSAGTSFKDTGNKTLTTVLTAYLYRGTEEYLPGALYYEWYTISEENQTGTALISGVDYDPIPAKDEEYIEEKLWKHKSIEIKDVAATLTNKSVYFIAYTKQPSTGEGTSAILNVARLGITTLGKN